jgi:hypothetical protein
MVVQDPNSLPGFRLYFLLSNTYSIITRAIGLYTGEPYNHVSIGFDAGLRELFSFGRLQPRNPLIGGFVQEEVDSGTFAHFKDTVCTLYQLEVTAEEYGNVRESVRQFEREKDKYSFNLIGFAGVATGVPINRQYAYFCSQFVSTVLQRGGVRLFDKPPGLVSPADFQHHPRLALVYEGRLADYPRQNKEADWAGREAMASKR